MPSAAHVVAIEPLHTGVFGAHSEATQAACAASHRSFGPQVCTTVDPVPAASH